MLEFLSYSSNTIMLAAIALCVAILTGLSGVFLSNTSMVDHPNLGTTVMGFVMFFCFEVFVMLGILGLIELIVFHV